MRVTLLNGLYKIQKGHVSLRDLMQQIKTGVFADKVFKVRQTLVFKGKKQYQSAKLELPCFTPSGRFGQAFKIDGKTKRPIPPTKRHLIEYNGIVVLDYDDLEDMELFSLQETIKECQYTFASFSSPSNKGYKVLVKTTNKDKEKHAEAFHAVRAFYKELTGVEDDKSSSNINRLCFVSVDAHLHYNENSEVVVFQRRLFERPEIEPSFTNKIPKGIPRDKITKAIERIESKGVQYVNGQRHEYVKQFSIECVKYGVLESECTNFVDSNFVSADCDAKKVLSVVKWAYENIKEVGIYEDWAKEQSLESSKPNNNSTEEYISDLYKEKEKEETVISIPELGEEQIYELDEKVRKEILYQRLVEQTLDEFFDFRINTLKNREEYKLKSWKKYREMDKIEYNSISRALKLHGVSCPPAKLEGIILSHFSKQVHPIKEMFERWHQQLDNDDDEVDYIKQVAQLVHTDAPKGLFEIVFKKWLVASVANVFIEGNCTNHHCLILCGKQETNKTTFFSSLFSSEYVFTGHIDLKNKDSLILLADTFIVDLDEQFAILDKAKDWETLKSTVTMPRIKARWHYAKTSKLAPRIANFCGIANRIEILQDDTGNRRFIPFQVTKPININQLRSMDITKMWAQAYRLYKDGWRYLPSQKEKLQIENYQKKFKKLDTEHKLISFLYEPCEMAHPNAELLSSAEIWEFLHKHYPIEKNVSLEKVGRAMSLLGFVQKRVQRDKGKRARYWVVNNVNQP